MKAIRRAFLWSVAALVLAAAVPAAAISAPSPRPSLAPLQMAPAAPSASSGLVAPHNVVYVDCHTFPGAPCYLSYFQNRGVSTVIFYATTGQRTHTIDCNANGCEEKWVGYPGFSGTAVAFVIYGPNINHAITSGHPI